jgi:hypothetical protein
MLPREETGEYIFLKLGWLCFPFKINLILIKFFIKENASSLNVKLS